MFELVGSTTTQQSVKGPSSKMGVKDTPRLTVFQSPPNAVATYHTLEFLGSISISAMRPVTRPGPIERIAMPRTASAFKDGAACAMSPALDPVDHSAAAANARKHHRFMGAPKHKKGYGSDTGEKAEVKGDRRRPIA